MKVVIVWQELQRFLNSWPGSSQFILKVIYFSHCDLVIFCVMLIVMLFRSIFNWAWKVLQDSFVFLHCFVMWLVQETHVTFSTNQWWLGNSLSLPFRQFAWFYFEFSLATCDIFLPMIGCFMYFEFAFTSPNWKAFYLLVSLPCFTLLCFTLPSFCYSFFTLHTLSFASLYALWRKCVPFTLS